MPLRNMTAEVNEVEWAEWLLASGVVFHLVVWPLVTDLKVAPRSSDLVPAPAKQAATISLVVLVITAVGFFRLFPRR